jgi:hypothetical protein
MTGSKTMSGPAQSHRRCARRVLAGGADRDVDAIHGELRDFRQATTASFNAMREGLADLRTCLDDIAGKVDRDAANSQFLVWHLYTNELG